MHPSSHDVIKNGRVNGKRTSERTDAHHARAYWLDPHTPHTAVASRDAFSRRLLTGAIPIITTITPSNRRYVVPRGKKPITPCDTKVTTN